MHYRGNIHNTFHRIPLVAETTQVTFYSTDISINKCENIEATLAEFISMYLQSNEQD